MTEIVFSTIINDLKEAVNSKKHPFRYFTLATSDISGRPRLRTVVLRDFDTDCNLYIYTDKRSKKITHIIERAWVSALFYDPEKLCQVVVRAKAFLVEDDHSIVKAWNEIPDTSRKDYTTKLKPGEEIKNPTVRVYCLLPSCCRVYRRRLGSQCSICGFRSTSVTTNCTRDITQLVLKIRMIGSTAPTPRCVTAAI